MLYYDTPKLRARFDVKVERSDDCWAWLSACDTGGYGRFFAGKLRGAHQIAWELASGEPVPLGLLVLHTCDHRPCVRNDEPGVYYVNGIYRPRFGHLFIGTNSDNQIDAVDKGRGNRRRGERHPKAILTAERVRALVAMYIEGYSQAAVAQRFGVSYWQVASIIRGNSWGHLGLQIPRIQGRRPRHGNGISA